MDIPPMAWGEEERRESSKREHERRDRYGSNSEGKRSGGRVMLAIGTNMEALLQQITMGTEKLMVVRDTGPLG